MNIVPKRDAPIDKVMQDYLNANKRIRKGFVNTLVKNVWKEKMGETISSYTRSIYFKEGKLFINITSSSLRMELAYSKTKIIDLYKEEISGLVINEVILR